MTPLPASASSISTSTPVAAALRGQPAAAQGQPGLLLREAQRVSRFAAPEADADDGSAYGRDSAGAMASLLHRCNAVRQIDSGSLADVVNLFSALKDHAEIVGHALKRTPGAPPLARLSQALVVLLRRFSHALVTQPDLLPSLDTDAIRSLCNGLSVCASPSAGPLFDAQQSRRVGPALQALTDAMLARLAELGMPESASANGVVLDILNWVSRGQKSGLLTPSAAVRESYGRALELFAAWLGSDHTRGFLSMRQLAKCAVQVDLMVKRRLLAMDTGTQAGGANRALLAQCGMGLCARAALERLDSGGGVEAVPLLNLCNAIRTLLEARVLQPDGNGLAESLAQLLGLVRRLTVPQLCAGSGQALSNCANFVRTVFEVGIHARPGGAALLPALDQASAHLVAAIDSLAAADSQAISNLISFVKLCDKRLQQADAAGGAYTQGLLMHVAGILQGRLLMQAPSDFGRAEAVGGVLCGLCYLWRRGLAAPTEALRAWVDALLRHMPGIPASQWDDKSRKVVLPALKALIELALMTLEAAQPALAVLLTAPAGASGRHTREALAQAIVRTGAIEEAVPALPPQVQAASMPAPASAPATALPRAIPGLTRLLAPTPTFAPAPKPASVVTPPAWQAPAKVARRRQPAAPDPRMQPAWPAPANAAATTTASACTTSTTSTTSTASSTAAAPGKKSPSGKRKPAASAAGPGRTVPGRRGQQPGRDKATMVEQYLGAAEQGNALAQYSLGTSYQFGIGVSKDSKASHHWYLKAAELGDARAQLRAGICYQYGIGTDEDRKAAFDWYRKAAEQGHAAAQLHLACCYQRGIGVRKDEKAAFDWFHKAAGQGDEVAQRALAECFRYGRGVGKDEQAAVSWHRRAGGPEHAATQTSRAYCNEHGLGVPRDQKAAFYWYRMAARQGDAAGQTGLGYCHEHGIGVDKDDAAALDWYRKAAEQGYAAAQFNMGLAHQAGRGVDRDEKAAVHWYGRAAEQQDVLARYSLGIAYRHGIGVTKDEQAADRWCRKATEEGDAAGEASPGFLWQYGIGADEDRKAAFDWYRKAAGEGRAADQAKLGYCYQHGIGARKDEKAGLRWYREAAGQGEPAAQFNMGLCYLSGTGVDKDEQAAVRWFSKAAGQGHAAAQTRLGHCYRYGSGVVRDEKAAVGWYRQAAGQGDAAAQTSLGHCHEHGIGVDQDDAAAFDWYRKAAGQGDARAQYRLAVAYRYGIGVAKDEQAAEEWCRKLTRRSQVLGRSR